MAVDHEMKYTYPTLMTNPKDRETWTVSTDHCYARPYNWRPEANFLRPTKTLFMPKVILTKRAASHPLIAAPSPEDEVDIETVAQDHLPVYDTSKAKVMMEECAKIAALAKPDIPDDWEENICRDHWTPAQARIFGEVVDILNSFHLARLASTNVHNEPILRRIIIDKAVQRFRRSLATVAWEVKTTQWLHQLLMENLNSDYLASYLDILRTLKAKLPTFVDKMIYGPNSLPRIGVLNNESLFNLLKRPWDPVATSLVHDKPKKLPGNPIIILVPSAPSTSRRTHRWITNLSNLATVVTIPSNFGPTGKRLNLSTCNDQLFAATRGKIQEVRANYPNRNIVLLGFNSGGTLALQVAQVEPVLCVISLGFSLFTAEGRRGELDDNLLELQCPVLFVIGQCSNNAYQEDMEDLRERMRIETGLIVVGAADEHLRVSKRKRRAEGITQSIVDRNIVDEIGEFISGIILSPFPPQIRQSPNHLTGEIKKQMKQERKRYNSNTSSLDSEPPSPKPRLPRQGSNNSNFGRPPGSKTKPKLEAKWAAQIAQGTPFNPTLSDSLSSTSNTPDTSSNDSFLTDKFVPNSKTQLDPQSPVKKIKTLKPVLSSDKTPRQPTSVKKIPASGPAKMQAYSMNRTGLPGSNSTLSTLLQGGIKTIPPTLPKEGIKVLENVHINSNTKGLSNSGRLDLSKITVLNSMSKASGTGNLVLLPDGKFRTIKGTGKTPIMIPGSSSNKPMNQMYSGKTSRNKYGTPRRHLIGSKPNRPTPSMKKSFVPGKNALPPPPSLTSEQIMDLPIIFADDNQLIDNPLPVQESVQTKASAPVANKFVLLNKQANPSNYIITPGMKKPQAPTQGAGAKLPKYTKIILSKRSASEELQSVNKIRKLSPEITIKKVDNNSMGDFNEPIDLENELVATAVPKPNLSTSDVKNITILSKSTGDIQLAVEQLRKKQQMLAMEKEDVSKDPDPDYNPESDGEF